MATTLKPKVEKKEITSEYALTLKSGYYNHHLCIQHNKKDIFEAEHEAIMATCCGINEVGGFNFFKSTNEKYNDELQSVFNKYVNHHHLDQDGSPAIRVFVLNRLTKDKKTLQPDWFVQCLNNYPGATCLDWTHNPNTGDTDIKPYFLPVTRDA